MIKTILFDFGNVLAFSLGLAALVVGLLVSIPVSSLAFIYAYRVLGGKAEPRPVDAALAA